MPMMRWKSPPFEHIILEKIKSNNSLGFKEDLEREIIYFLNYYFKLLNYARQSGHLC